VRETGFESGFVDSFHNDGYAGRTPLLSPEAILLVLTEFRRLRLTDQTIYLRNAAINLINGMINMSFSCDGTHYIDYKTFLAKLDKFETPS